MFVVLVLNFGIPSISGAGSCSGFLRPPPFWNAPYESNIIKMVLPVFCSSPTRRILMQVADGGTVAEHVTFSFRANQKHAVLMQNAWAESVWESDIKWAVHSHVARRATTFLLYQLKIYQGSRKASKSILNKLGDQTAFFGGKQVNKYVHTVTYIPNYLPTYLPTYIHTYIHKYMQTDIQTYTHSRTHTYI